MKFISNLEFVKVAQEARNALKASDDAFNEMRKFGSDFDSKRDVWFTSFNRAMQLDEYIQGYFASLKWRAA